MKQIIIPDANLKNVSINMINLHYSPEKRYSKYNYFSSVTSTATSHSSSYIEHVLTVTIVMENKNAYPVNVQLESILINPNGTQCFNEYPPKVSMNNLHQGVGKCEIDLSRYAEKHLQVRLTGMHVFVDNFWYSKPLDKVIYDRKIKPRKPLSFAGAIVISVIIAAVLYKAINFVLEKNREARYQGVYSGVISRDSNVRDNPSLDGKVLYQLKKGMNVIITDTISGPEFTFEGKRKKYFKIVQSNYYLLYPEEVKPLWVWGGNVEDLENYYTIE